MEQKKQRALSAIEERREQLCGLSDALWEHPEVGFHENFAAQAFCRALEQEGFRVERDLAVIKTAFSGTFGEGGPVIGFLGEFDALPGLSQEAGAAEQKAIEEGAPGHGCGHNLLGVGLNGGGHWGEAVSAGESSAGHGEIFRMSGGGGRIGQGLYGPGRCVPGG